MPITNSPESYYFTGTLDTASGPLDHYHPKPNSVFVGDDGKTYQVMNYASGLDPFAFHEIDYINGTRTLKYTLGVTEYQTKVTAKAGFPTPSFADCVFLGVMQPTNFLLFARMSGLGNGTTFSLWKVDNTGTPDCVAAINFAHGGDTDLAMRCVNVAGISGDGGRDKAIIVHFGSEAFVSKTRCWRLPGIDDFIAANGTYYSSTVTYNNCVYPMNGYNERFGYQTTAKIGYNGSSTYTRRKCVGYGWLAPKGDKTRMYFYSGPGDVATAPSGVNDYVHEMSLTHGNQFLSWIDLGTPVFNTSSAWTGPFTFNVDNTLLQKVDGTSYIPFSLYDADGTTIDAGGWGDYTIAPNWVYLPDGRRLLLFGGGPQQDNSLNQYTGSSYDFSARWLAFLYDSTTGIHTFAGKGTFYPCSRVKLTNGVSYSNRHFPTSIRMDYDPISKRLVWNVTVTPTDYTGNDRNLFGFIGTFDFVPGSAFLQEVDTSYKDFVAKFP